MAETSAVYDFSGIAARLREIKSGPETDNTVTYCSACEDSGWVYYGTGHNDPHFKECEECGNPNNFHCP